MEEKVRNTLQDISVEFLEKSSKAKEAENKTNRWDYIKLTGFYTVKEKINKVKRQLTELEKIFAHYTGDISLISRIYKELWNNHNIKANKPVKNGHGKLAATFKRNKFKWLTDT